MRQWKFDNTQWLFEVDNSTGCRVLECNQQTSYADCIQMVFEDYGLDHREHDVVLTYKLSKTFSQNLPGDTPPDIIGNYRQFHTFLGQLKRKTVRLYVEVKKKSWTNQKKKQKARKKR